MGSCASIYRNSDSSGKYRGSIVHSETDKHLNSVPSSPLKNNSVNHLVVDRPIASQLSSVNSFANYGSKEEAFFDSQAWLESDCDDDFYSVKGDFTPSCGSTPIHSSRAGTPRSRTLSPQLISKALFEARSPVYNETNGSFRGSTPQVDVNGNDNEELGGSSTNTSLTEKKKLADLFRESIRENKVEDFNHEAETLKSGNTTPYVSGTNSQTSSAKRTPMETRESDEEKQLKSAQCCFPRLPSARVLKKTFVATTPPIAVDAKG